MSKDVDPVELQTSPVVRRVVPREQLTAYQRWELPALEEQLQRASAQLNGVAQDGPALPTASELEALQQQAWAEGLRNGVEEGRAEVAARLRVLDAALRECASANAVREAGLAEHLLELALAVARQVIGSELANRPEALLAVIRSALEALPTGGATPVLHLNPVDHAWLTASAGLDPAWRLVADPQVARGGCRLQSGDSAVDASVPARWQQVVAALGRSDPWEPTAPGGVAPIDGTPATAQVDAPSAAPAADV